MLAQVGDDKVSHVTGTALSAEQWWIEAEIQASLSDTTQGSSVEQSVQALVNRLRVMTGPDRSLAALVTLLTSYHDKLSLAVSHVIESQYAHFLTLHRRQHHLLSLIQLLRPKLTALQGDMTEISHVIDTHVAHLHLTLAHRRELLTKKQLLKLFLDTEHSIVQVERLIALFGSASAEDSEEDEVLVLERIANQLTSVKYHVRAVRELPLLLKHAQRTQRVTQQLLAQLARIVLSALGEAATSHSGAGGHALTPFDRLVTAVRIYRQLEEGSHVLDELLQTQFVRPRIDKLFSGIDLDDLRPLFAQLIQFAERELRVLIDLQHVTGHNMLVHVIWPEIARRLELDLTRAFSSGIIATFHLNYTAAMIFLDKFEQLMPHATEVSEFRAHANYRSFIARWHVTLYSQLRLRELSAPLDTWLSREVLVAHVRTLVTPVNEAPPQYTMEITREIWSALVKCWDKELFLASIAHRLLKFSLQLLHKYHSHVLTYIDQTLTKNDVSAVSTKISILHDYIWLESQLEHDLARQIEHVIAPLARDIVTGILAAARDNTRALIDHVDPAVVSHVTGQINQGLQALKQIPGHYRLTGRAAPTAPSLYVHDAFQPLRAWLDHVLLPLLGTHAVVSEWRDKVLTEARDSYQVLVASQVSAVLKTHEFLSKMKRQHHAGTALSDEDKMSLQLFLDTHAFVQLLRAWEPASHVLDTVPQLLSTVAFAEKFKREE
jgi:hypothetical protein